ncbi:MAG: leucine-rich repeat protein [Lachnospiraceae bacterium]|nr:leucine-rich repeat protein [Lachnospiraceae bacterium]
MRKYGNRSLKKTGRKMVSLFLTLALFLSCLPSAAFADPVGTTGDWTDYTQEVSPDAQGVYKISTARQLAWVAKTLNEGNLEQEGCTVRLLSDIDLSAHYWIPMGTLYAYRFTGTFDGNGHTITGMNVGAQTEPYSGMAGGLIGYLDGSVKDLKITDSKVCLQVASGSMQQYTGLLAGSSSGTGVIRNCEVSGSVFTKGCNSLSNGCVGGVVGSSNKGTIEACRATVTLGLLDADGFASFGGITGGVSNTTSNATTVKNCVSDVTVSVPEGTAAANAKSDAFFAAGKNGVAINSIGIIDHGGTKAGTCSVPTRTNACYAETDYTDGNGINQTADYSYYDGDGNLSTMTVDEMKADTFVTTLNTAAAGIEGALTWSIDENKNNGFPDLADAKIGEGNGEQPSTYCTVTFKVDGNVYKTETVESGQTVAKPADPVGGEEDVFQHWYTTDPATAYNFSSPVTGDLTLNAKWKDVTYTVCFDSMGGSYVYPKTVARGEAVTVPVAPTKKGCTFGGWYKDADYNDAWDFDGVVTGSMTLYAKWNGTEEVSISGRITDATSKDGIQNAIVTLSDGKNATTDEFGYYRISDVAQGSYGVTVTATGYEEASREGFPVGEISTSLDVALTKSNTAAGGTKPVNIYANVSCVYSGIMLDGVEVRAVGEGSLGTYSKVTDAGGNAMFTSLPAGNYTFYINHAGKGGWESYTSATKPLNGDYQLSCALKPDYESLTVKVIGSYDPKTNKTNMPLSGKEVKLTGVDPKNEDKELIHLTAYTDANGCVTVQKMVPITWKISCSDYSYTEAEETVYSDASGDLSEEEVTLTLPFVDSSVTVDLTSIYSASDPDLFKKTDDNGKAGTLDVTLSGISGTLTEGISRCASPDASGKVTFTGLFPGNYNLTASGKVSRFVSIKAGDGQEIFTDTDIENFSRFGRKHFDIDFYGTGTASVALGCRSNATVEVDPAPVSFSGTLYKSDMNDKGEITTAPLANTKIYIKSSAYYRQSGEAQNGHEITTDSNGHYAISLAPGLYGVEVDSAYKDYFGGRLIYHEGHTDGYIGRWGWPCTDTWSGSKASAVAWMTSDDGGAFGDIGGMGLSSGSVVADLELMEKKFNYSAGTKGGAVVYDNTVSQQLIVGYEKDEEPTESPNTSAYNCFDYYANTYGTINYNPDTRGASVKLTSGSGSTSVDLTGKTLPVVFHDLAPGDYSLDYSLSAAFSQLKPSVSWGGETSFFNFPAPGKLPADFPEDYADNNNPDINNPWPLSTVGSLLKIEAATGRHYFRDLYDGDDSNGELKIKFYTADTYYVLNSSGASQSQVAAWRTKYGEGLKDLKWINGDGTIGTEAEGTYTDPPQRENYETEDEYLAAYNSWDQSEYTGRGFPKNGRWYAKIEGTFTEGSALSGEVTYTGEPHLNDDYENTQTLMEKYLVAYSTSKIPEKLFRVRVNASQNKVLPDGTVTLYFCAPKGAGNAFLSNIGFVCNRETNYSDQYNSDLWFAVTLDNSGATDCEVNLLNQSDCSSGVTILSQTAIDHLLNPRTIAVKAVESSDSANVLDNVAVTMTYAGKQFSSTTPAAMQTCCGEVTDVQVVGDAVYEWECDSNSTTSAVMDDSTNTETFYVPVRRILYEYGVQVNDDAGNVVSGASVNLAGVSCGEPSGAVTGPGGSASLLGNDRLTYQDYTLSVTAPGYAPASVTLTKEEIRAGTPKSVVLTRVEQPTFPNDALTLDRKGAFLPGVNFVGSSNTVEFLTNLGAGKLYVTAEAKVDTGFNDYIRELYLVDGRTFQNPDYSDKPAKLNFPAMEGEAYSPSAAREWIESLESGGLGNVYYQRFSQGKDIMFTDLGEVNGYHYELSICVPLWELPPDGFEPALVAVTDRGAVQIFKADYSGENAGDQLVGMRVSGDSAVMLNNITLMANAKAVGGGAVEKLAELSQPTGSLIPLPSFESGIELDDDGFLDYTYSIKMQLLQGKKSVSDAEKAYMSILPSTLGVAVEGGWNMEMAGKDRALLQSFDVAVSAQDLDMEDYLPGLFKALPVKVEFDDDNPPTGRFTLAATDTRDKDNVTVEEAYSFGANAQVHVNAEVSGFAAFGAIPPVGPVLASLEKSGALDIGAKVEVAVGADGTYTYTIKNGNETEHDVTFTLGAGAGLGIYAKALGGALGAEAKLKLSGDNDKLEDMVTISASVNNDGLHLNSVDGKVKAEAHIEIDTWFINGEKDFDFLEIPFSYQFGTVTQFNLTAIKVTDNMRSRNDFDVSVFNGRPDTVVSNLLPIGGYAADEDGNGTFLYTDMSAKGGNVRLQLAQAAGSDTWSQPVTVTATDGLIPAFDVISLSGGKYLVVWSEISKANMQKTCPPSVIKYAIGTVSGSTFSGNAQTLDTLTSEVAGKLMLVSSTSGVSLIASRTSEGALAGKQDIAGYKFNGTSFAEGIILAKDQPLYEIEAAAKGGNVFVTYVTDDLKLNTLNWADSVSAMEQAVTGFETALASDGTNLYLLCEEETGLILYKWNGTWQKQAAATQMRSPGNPGLSFYGGKVYASWTGENDTKLYHAVVNGTTVGKAEVMKSAVAGHFEDVSIFAAEDQVKALAIRSVSNASTGSKDFLDAVIKKATQPSNPSGGGSSGGSSGGNNGGNNTQTQPAASGTTVTDGTSQASYVVTSNAGETPEVSYKASSNTSAKKVEVPATVKVNGVDYKVTSVEEGAFKNNKTVTEVKIGKNVETIEKSAFEGCTSLTKITIPASVTSIGDKAFSGDKKLKTVSVGSNVTSIGAQAFAGCTSLTKMTLPKKVAKIGGNAFKNCKKMKTLIIKSTKLTAKSVKKNAFKGLTKKTTIKVPKSKLKAYKTLFKKKGLSKKVKVKKI